MSEVEEVTADVKFIDGKSILSSAEFRKFEKENKVR